jgi:hypothetical protein
MSAPVRSSHSRPLSVRDRPDWRCLERATSWTAGGRPGRCRGGERAALTDVPCICVRPRCDLERLVHGSCVGIPSSTVAGCALCRGLAANANAASALPFVTGPPLAIRTERLARPAAARAYGGIRKTSAGARFPFNISCCRSASGYARATASYVGASMMISPSRATDVRRAAVFVTSPTAVKSL